MRTLSLKGKGSDSYAKAENESDMKTRRSRATKAVDLSADLKKVRSCKGKTEILFSFF